MAQSSNAHAEMSEDRAEELLRQQLALSYELVLTERAAAAYARARREVYDVLPIDTTLLSFAQRQVLVDLEVADGELRRFRAQRMAPRSGGDLTAG